MLESPSQLNGHLNGLLVPEESLEARKKASYEEFIAREGYLPFKFKSVLEPRFQFIKVSEFDMPHKYYVDTLY